MLGSLTNHPFAVEAFFERSLVLTYAVEATALAPLLPPCLVPDTWQERWGFVAVALVQTRHLRPAGWPAWLGTDFFLIGYRVFVRYRTAAGRRLRGLYILRSETDKRLMELAGNALTHYRYHQVDITQQRTATGYAVSSQAAGLRVAVQEPAGTEARLPAKSPFATWAEARRFAGPLPFTFSYDAAAGQVLLIEGVREHWQPQPVEVLAAQADFVHTLGLGELQLASAFLVENIPYRWEKGRLETWPHP